MKLSGHSYALYPGKQIRHGIRWRHKKIIITYVTSCIVTLKLFKVLVERNLINRIHIEIVFF